MKCRNCGNELAEGCLYCEQCGQEIHIVPDFDPELELNLEQTIQETILHIAGELKDDGAKTDLPKKNLKIGKLVVLTFCLILGIFVAVFIELKIRDTYRYDSLDYQMSKAKQYVTEEKYEEALTCYSRALDLDSENIEILFSLAEVYFLKNEKTEYEYLLWEIVEREDADALQLERAYGKLIAIYRAKGNYKKIHDMLIACDNQDSVAVYCGYVSEAPKFNIQEGYYTNIQALKLAAAGNGKIYYTMDGSNPDENSQQYTIPIILENGYYQIKAVYVNENGVYSDIASKEYHVESHEIGAPEVAPLDGNYYYPVDIEILHDTENIYYTTDGKDPTLLSNQYTGPIPMPLGVSTFKFAKIVDGIVGNITIVSYDFRMHTGFFPEDAAAAVTQYALESGRIRDLSGIINDNNDYYLYEYLYVTNINEMDDFYVISEVLRTADGTIGKTGLEYAVNAYTGKIFMLNQDNGYMNLIELEITH